MEIRDTPQPDDAVPDRTRPVAHGSRGSGLDRTTEDALHAALRSLADEIPPPPPGDPLAGVMTRVRRIKLRRRIVRACASTTALTLAVLFGPGLVGQVQRWHQPNETAAAPPAAVLDLTVAYPAPEAPMGVEQATVDPAGDVPVNALNWPARGPGLPTAALDLARSYLLTEAKIADDRVVDSAVVSQLWARQEPDRQTWLYAVEGWTVGPDGAAAAQILAGEYTPTASKALKISATRVVEPEMTVFTAPIRFTHPAPGTSPDPEAAARIAEYSIWLPSSDRLLVLGAPQVRTVYYAKDGREYVAQATEDGVALFQRAKTPAHGALTDLVQVRDARNQALTPPVGWSTPDLSMSGPGASYTSGAGWFGIPGLVPATTVVPATPVPSGPPMRPTPATGPSRGGIGRLPTMAPVSGTPTVSATPSGTSPLPTGGTGPSPQPGASATALPTPAASPTGTPVSDPPSGGIAVSPSGISALW